MGAGDGAEGEGALRRRRLPGYGREAQRAADAPVTRGWRGGSATLRGQIGVFLAQNEDVGAAEGGEGFAEVAGGEEAVAEIVAVEEDNLNVSSKLAVLEAVVEEVYIHTIAHQTLGEEAGMIAAISNKYREMAGEQEGLVAVFGGCSRGIHPRGGMGGTAVSAGEDIGFKFHGIKQLGESEDEGRLARAAGGEVAHADDGLGEVVDAQ